MEAVPSIYCLSAPNSWFASYLRKSIWAPGILFLLPGGGQRELCQWRPLDLPCRRQGFWLPGSVCSEAGPVHLQGLTPAGDSGQWYPAVIPGGSSRWPWLSAKLPGGRLITLKLFHQGGGLTGSSLTEINILDKNSLLCPNSFCRDPHQQTHSTTHLSACIS